jgi:hypothetical protein
VYWPEDITGKVTIGNFTITLVEEQQFAENVVRKLKYSFKNVSLDERLIVSIEDFHAWVFTVCDIYKS